MTETDFRAVKHRLSQIGATADAIGAPVVLALVPAPVQVCEPHTVAYFPKSVDLLDTSLYGVDLPQQLTQHISHNLELVT